MPKYNGVTGHSEATKFKHMCFKEVVCTHFKICQFIISKNSAWCDSTYYYYDLNAGPGIIDGHKGSPLIFLEEIALPLNNGQTVKSYFFEYDKDNCIALSNEIQNLDLPRNIYSPIVIHGDNKVRFEEVLTDKNYNKFGMAFSDPNGLDLRYGMKGVTNFDLLRAISITPGWKYVDFLINCNTQAIKRVRPCSVTHEDRNLEEFIMGIDKKYWIIRVPEGHWNFSMLIGTNWDRYPTDPTLGFVRLDSKEGQEIFKKLN